MSDAQQAQAELVEEFSFFDNWMDRYQYIIDMGKALPEYPEELKGPETKIDGCQSNVWMIPTCVVKAASSVCTSRPLRMRPSWQA